MNAVDLQEVSRAIFPLERHDEAWVVHENEQDLDSAVRKIAR